MYWKYSEEQSTHSLETYIVTGREKVTVLSIIKKKKKKGQDTGEVMME